VENICGHFSVGGGPGGELVLSRGVVALVGISGPGIAEGVQKIRISGIDTMINTASELQQVLAGKKRKKDHLSYIHNLW
jgi:hypothetical protein